MENNDASSIQLKLRTQIEVNAETALEKVPINGEQMTWLIVCTQHTQPMF
jgi:hypothetical protein